MRNLLVVAAVIAVAGYFGAKLYIQHKVARDLDSVLTQARPFVDVSYENVVATMGGELRVEGIEIQLQEYDDAFTIDSVGVQTPGFLFLLGFDHDAREFEFPERLGIEVSGMRASVDADFMYKLDDYGTTQVRAADLTPADRCAGTYGLTPVSLKRLGYHELVVDFNASFRRQADQLVMELGAEVENAYEVDLTVTFAGMSDPTALARGARPLLVNARMDYVDRSLNGRILAHCAEQQVSADEVIAAQILEVETLARSSGMELDAMLIGPYTEFLRGKQRLTVTSQPSRPVDLTRIGLYKPSDVPNLLNLMAEAI